MTQPSFRDAAWLPDAEITEAPRLQQRLTRDVRFQRGIPSPGGGICARPESQQMVRGPRRPVPRRAVCAHAGLGVAREHFSFTPSSGGDYDLYLYDGERVKREMRMEVIECIKKMHKAKKPFSFMLYPLCISRVMRRDVVE